MTVNLNGDQLKYLLVQLSILPEFKMTYKGDQLTIVSPHQKEADHITQEAIKFIEQDQSMMSKKRKKVK